jgi:hypothetical protein
MRHVQGVKDQLCGLIHGVVETVTKRQAGLIEAASAVTDVVDESAQFGDVGGKHGRGSMDESHSIEATRHADGIIGALF